MGYYLSKGDYYRGDYYRGDPGFFSTLGGILGKVGSAVGQIATGNFSGAIGTVFGSSSPGRGSPPTPPVGMPLAGGRGVARVPKMKVPKALGAGQTVDPNTGVVIGHRRRRMNPLNVKALRRADRRARSFLHITRSVVKHYVPKAPKGRAYIHTKRRKRA